MSKGAYKIKECDSRSDIQSMTEKQIRAIVRWYYKEPKGKKPTASRKEVYGLSRMGKSKMCKYMQDWKNLKPEYQDLLRRRGPPPPGSTLPAHMFAKKYMALEEMNARAGQSAKSKKPQSPASGCDGTPFEDLTKKQLTAYYEKYYRPTKGFEGGTRADMCAYLGNGHHLKAQYFDYYWDEAKRHNQLPRSWVPLYYVRLAKVRIAKSSNKHSNPPKVG